MRRENGHKSIAISVADENRCAEQRARLVNSNRALVGILIGMFLYNVGRIGTVILASSFAWEDATRQAAIIGFKLLAAAIPLYPILRESSLLIRLPYLFAIFLTALTQSCRLLELDTTQLSPILRGLDIVVIVAIVFTTYRLLLQSINDKRDLELELLNTLALRTSGSVGDEFLNHLLNGIVRQTRVKHAYLTEQNSDVSQEIVVATSAEVNQTIGKVMNEDLLRVDASQRTAIQLASSQESSTTAKPTGQIYLVHDPDFQLTDHQLAALHVFGSRAAAELERRRLDAANSALELKIRQAQKLESLGIMAGGIAHDFNNLLAAVRSNSDGLLEKVQPDAIDCVIGIQLAVEKGKSLCDTLLAYSGNSVSKKSAVDVQALLKQLKTVLHASSPEQRFELGLCETSCCVWADEGQLSQVFLNLMKNAQEASEGLHVGIEVNTWIESHQDSDFVFIRVADHGVGINSENTKRLFDPFFTTKGAGRGLGLAAVLGIVRRHGGDIDVHSEVGTGTSFVVKLPRTMEVSSQSSSLPRRELQAAEVEKRVLLVDDDELLRKSVEIQLNRLGMQVKALASGNAAIEAVQHDARFDVAIIDQTMAGLSGIDTILRLREMSVPMKTILTSGYNEFGVGDLPTDLVFLAKPFTEKDLLLAIQSATQSELV